MTVTVTHAFTNPVADDPTFTGVKPSHWNAAHTVTGLGTAAELNVGTSANNIVQLDGSGKLPAVDGSQLTNLPGGSGAVDSVNGFTGTVVLDPDDLDDSATTNKFTTASDISKLAAIEASADVTDAGNVGSSIHGASAKTTPVDADTVPLIDSAASNALKKVTWANVKATLKSYFDTVYQAAGSYLTASSTATLTNKTIDANGTGNSITNLETADFAANVIDTDTSLTANSNTRIASQAAVKAYVDANAGGGSSVPTGTVLPFAGTTEPSGYLFCYGQAISRTTYADLFAAISTTYGVGDGSTTFNLPDIRGRVVAGKDDMGGVSANRLTNQSGGLNGDTLGATGGSETHTLTVPEIPAHSHTQRGNGGGSGTNNKTDLANRASGNQSSVDTTANTGGDGAHNNVQPTIILNYIIKT